MNGNKRNFDKLRSGNRFFGLQRIVFPGVALALMILVFSFPGGILESAPNTGVRERGGRVLMTVYARGASLERAGSRRALAIGSIIKAGDVIITGKGELQVQNRAGSIIGLDGNSRVKVERISRSFIRVRFSRGGAVIRVSADSPGEKVSVRFQKGELVAYKGAVLRFFNSVSLPRVRIQLGRVISYKKSSGGGMLAVRHRGKNQFNTQEKARASRLRRVSPAKFDVLLQRGAGFMPGR